MTRLPQPGADDGQWGTILNEYLSQSHNADGTLKDAVVGTPHIVDGSVAETKLTVAVQSKLNSVAPVQSVAGRTGTVTLTKTDVGLTNVDNTSDDTKNNAVATLANKTLTSPIIEKISNLSSNGLVTTSSSDGTLGVSTLPLDSNKYLDGFGNFTAPQAVLVERGDFAINTTYTRGDIVTYQYARWYRINTGSGGATFTPTDWIHLGLHAIGATSDPGGGMLWIDVS